MYYIVNNNSSKRQTAFCFSIREKFWQFSRETALIAGTKFLFWPSYTGIHGCTCFELNLSANMYIYFYRAMIYFYFDFGA